MKNFRYYQVTNISNAYLPFGQKFIFKENAEKLKNKLNKQFGVVFIVEKCTITFQDGD